MKQIDCLCLGISLLDLTISGFDVDFFNRDNVPIDGIYSFAGGDATNQAIILNRMGLDIQLNALIGKDDIADVLTAKLMHNGLSLKSLRTSEEVKTSISIIFVKDNGKRNIISQRGNNYEFDETHIDFKAIKNARALSIGSIYGCIKLEPNGIKKALKAAKENGATTFADLAEDKRNEKLNGLKSYINLIDYFIPSYDQASDITGETEPEKIIKRIKNIGARNAILKLGETGLLIDTEDFKGHINGFKTGKIVDTTGAGDAFLACFIYSILDGNGVKKAAEFAACGAAVSCKFMGANTAPLSMELINDYMKKGHG
jgi:sugar/nucleoside kinase (ribokinase family)